MGARETYIISRPTCSMDPHETILRAIRSVFGVGPCEDALFVPFLPDAFNDVGGIDEVEQLWLPKNNTLDIWSDGLPHMPPDHFGIQINTDLQLPGDMHPVSNEELEQYYLRALLKGKHCLNSNTEELVVIPCKGPEDPEVELLTMRLSPIVIEEGEANRFGSDIIPYTTDDRKQIMTLLLVMLSNKLPRVVAAMPMMYDLTNLYDWKLSPERTDGPGLRIGQARVTALVIALTASEKYQQYNAVNLVTEPLGPHEPRPDQHTFVVADEIFCLEDSAISDEVRSDSHKAATRALLGWLKSNVSCPIYVTWIPEDVYSVFYDHDLFPCWAMAALFPEPAIVNDATIPGRFTDCMPIELIHMLMASPRVQCDAKELNGTVEDLNLNDFTCASGVILPGPSREMRDGLVQTALDERPDDEDI